MAAAHTLHATLPPAPGVNALWRYAGTGNVTRVYKTATAVQWEQTALLLLRAAGFRRLPTGWYWLDVSLVVWTCRLDIDAPLKLVLDTLATALAIDDALIGQLLVRKALVPHRSEQRLELAVTVEAVASRQEWGARSTTLLKVAETR